MLVRELETAIRLARVAGEAALSHYSSEVVAECKIGADNFTEPVTAADREASRIIVAGLAKEFPNDGILSEEEKDHVANRIASDRVWIIDPIDGTAGFIKRDGDFAVQIGLAIEGRPAAGVVYLPWQNVLYYASRGEGAFSIAGNALPKRLQTSERTDFSEMHLAVSRNHRSPRITQIIRDLGFMDEVQRGSVGLKVGLIVERECDVYIHLSPRTKLWDTCAPQIILEEAGGKLTDLWGRDYSYDRPDVQNWGGIVATNGLIHEQTISRLKPLLIQFGRHKTKSHAGVSQ